MPASQILDCEVFKAIDHDLGILVFNRGPESQKASTTIRMNSVSGTEHVACNPGLKHISQLASQWGKIPEILLPLLRPIPFVTQVVDKTTYRLENGLIGLVIDPISKRVVNSIILAFASPNILIKGTLK